MKTDLRQYSDEELSLWVMNDEGLYRSRRSLRVLTELLDELFIYTDEQMEVLKQDLEDEENEENANENADLEQDLD